MVKKLLFTLLFGMLVLTLANAQPSSMKIETYKIDNVSTRGLNPNTKGDEEFELGDFLYYGTWHHTYLTAEDVKFMRDSLPFIHC